MKRTMRCQFEECRRETTIPMESATHLIVAIGEDNRTYMHGPLFEEADKPLLMRMLIEVARLAKIDLQELVTQERIFHERERQGMTMQ